MIAVIVYHLRRRDLGGLVLGLTRLWRFNRSMARWDRQRGAR